MIGNDLRKVWFVLIWCYKLIPNECCMVTVTVDSDWCCNHLWFTRYTSTEERRKRACFNSSKSLTVKWDLVSHLAGLAPRSRLSLEVLLCTQAHTLWHTWTDYLCVRVFPKNLCPLGRFWGFPFFFSVNTLKKLSKRHKFDLKSFLFPTCWTGFCFPKVRVYACGRVCVCVCLHIYIYNTHTHTHTHTCTH